MVNGAVRDFPLSFLVWVPTGLFGAIGAGPTVVLQRADGEEDYAWN